MYSNMLLASLEREGKFKITAQDSVFSKSQIKKGKKNEEKQELWEHDVFGCPQCVPIRQSWLCKASYLEVKCLQNYHFQDSKGTNTKHKCTCQTNL